MRRDATTTSCAWRQRRGCAGLTLVELVITITILGIIAAVAMPRMARSQQVRQAFNVESAIRGQFAKARDRAMLTGRPQGVAFFGPGSATAPAQIVVLDNVTNGLVNIQTQLASRFEFADPLWIDATPGNGSGMGPGFVQAGGGFVPMLEVTPPSGVPATDSCMIFDAYGQPNSLLVGTAPAPSVVSISNVRVVQQPVRVQYSVAGMGRFRAEIAPLSGEMGPAALY